MTQKKQSPSRNADTAFMNSILRTNDQLRRQRSEEIRRRERLARERARAALEEVMRL